MKTSIAICTPMPTIVGLTGPRLEPITVEWHRARSALSVPTNTNTIDLHVDGMEVGEARCRAVEMVQKAQPPPEFLFFLDYDVVPAFDALTKLVFRAHCFKGHDIIAGVYCSKGSPPEPLIYRENGGGPCWDWAVGDLLTEGITGVHMGCTLLRMSLFEQLDDVEAYFKTIREARLNTAGLRTKRGTEDLFFCTRAIEEAGAKILVDTSVLCGHIQNSTGQIFGLPPDSPPAKRAKWMRRGQGSGVREEGAEEQDAPPLKKAIDLGAGATRRNFEGYETETTDLRPGVADYAMDTRLLNFPDEHFDLVASSHHLEHFARSEQEGVWREMVRVLTPGGRMEHIVPNIEWAGGKISDGEVDEHVYNVLYGAQEAHGYERELNAHFFGYTPAVIASIAEAAGLVDVEIRTYRDEPDLVYNLVFAARKPEQENDEARMTNDEELSTKT